MAKGFKATTANASTKSGLDTQSTISQMALLTAQGNAATLAAARDQLQMSLTAGLSNIIKGVGSNIKSASQGG